MRRNFAAPFALVALLAGLTAAFAFKIKYDGVGVFGPPIHENITRQALESVVVYLPSGKVAKVKEDFILYVAEENTENDESGINEGMLHFDDSQLVDSARHTFFAVENAITAFVGGDYSTGFAYTCCESKVQANLGSAMHTVQDFFAHSTWVETNVYFDAFDALSYPSDKTQRMLPLPKIGMLEYPFNESGFLAGDGITLLDDKKLTTAGDDIKGGCTKGGYQPSILQLTSAYYDFKMSSIPLSTIVGTDLGFSTTEWNGECVATGGLPPKRGSCEQKIAWPENRCVHGDSGKSGGINKDEESRANHFPAYNAAMRASTELMLHFIRRAGAATTANEAKACALIFDCTDASPPKIGAPAVIANPFGVPSWDKRKLHAFTIEQKMNFLLEVSYDGQVCQLIDESTTVTSKPEKFFACPIAPAKTGVLKIYQKANPAFILYQSNDYVANPITECLPGRELVNGVCVLLAPTVTLTATPAQLSAGGSTVLQWSTSNATNCSATGAWTGPRNTSGSSTDTPPSGTNTYTLTCIGLGGSGSASATVVVAAPLPAPVVTFAVQPAQLVAGNSATLQWSSTNATGCSAGGAWSGTKAASGTATVTPAAGSYTYTLICEGSGGTGSASTTLVVASPASPPLVTLGISPASIVAGASSTLQWSATNATACTANGAWSGARSTSGSLVVAPVAGSYTYTLSCSGAGGATSASTTLTVTAAQPVTPAPTIAISAAPSSIATGSSATVQWSTTNASSCTASGAWSGARATAGSQAVTPAAGTYTYTLTCLGDGGTVQASALLTVTATTTAAACTLPGPGTSCLVAKNAATGAVIATSAADASAAKFIPAADWPSSIATSYAHNDVLSNTQIICYASVFDAATLNPRFTATLGAPGTVSTFDISACALVDMKVAILGGGSGVGSSFLRLQKI